MTTEREVAVEFSAKDKTTAVINKITKAAVSLSNTVDSISAKVVNFGKTFGGLGAIFGFGASAHSAREYLRSIEEITTITGMAANNAAGLTQAMEQSGLRAEESRAILISMARKQADIAAGSQEMVKLAKKYGVELTKGPETALISMAKQVEKGKIGTGEVVKLLEESGAKAMDLLRKGPAEVQRIIAEGQERMSHVNNETIMQYKQFDIQSTRVKQAWTRITTIVAVKLMPALTAILDKVEKNIDGWTEGAKRFGEWMSKNMDSIISSARTFGKIMLANYSMMKLTGSGILGTMGKATKMALGSKPETGGRVFKGGAKEALMGKAFSGGIGNKGMVLFARILSKIPKVGPVLTKFFFGIVSLKSLAMILLKFSGIAIVAMAIIGAFRIIKNNVDGIVNKFKDLFAKIGHHVGKLKDAFVEMFGPNAPLGKIMRFFGTVVVKVFEKVLVVVEKILWFFRVAAKIISKALEGELMSYSEASASLHRAEATEARHKAGMLQLGKQQWQSQIAFAENLMKTGKKVTPAMQKMFMEMKTGSAKYGLKVSPELERYFSNPAERPQVVQDFRGSRFEITQQFAEGFDPDRIAVTFANDLSSLGERRLQSGLAPTFAVR